MERDDGSPTPPRSALGWVALFGPGAVIASLTIGAGELIFSSRAGALFGYRLLWFFVIVLFLKWCLVLTTSRHMVLTGAHPFQRWMELPGPRGWLPLVLFLLAAVCFPIWVSFHAATLGGLVAERTGTAGSHFLWGMAAVGLVTLLSGVGGYRGLEGVQIVLVLVMLAGVTAALFVLQPDWAAFSRGLLLPGDLRYPAWVPETISTRPIWLEVVTYVGVLGGGGYDYLAYVSYLRSKRWGQSGNEILSATALLEMEPAHRNRRWLRAVWVDLGLSFAAVLVFSAVFLAAGAIVLGAAEKVPVGADLLSLQAAFVSPLFPWLKPVYFAAAGLTIFGTLYGTMEVAPAIFREMAEAFRAKPCDEALLRRIRRWSIHWMGWGGCAVLLGSFLYQVYGGAEKPPGLIAILTPANLFTGVMACGIVCWLGCWADWRHLPQRLRLPWPLMMMNLLAGAVFVALGLKGYWDHSGWKSYSILLGTVGVGMGGALAIRHLRNSR